MASSPTEGLGLQGKNKPSPTEGLGLQGENKPALKRCFYSEVVQGGLTDGERLFEEPSTSQAGTAETGAGVHLGPPRENQTDSAQPPKRRCLPENRSSGSDAGRAVCAVVPGSFNENHMDTITPLGVVDTVRAESAAFRRLPAVGQSHSLTEARAVEEYNKFFQGQVQLIARPLSERYAAWLELCTPLPPWINNCLSMGLRLWLKTKPPPFKWHSE